MANFTKAVEKVLEHEGGYVDHPLDRGGATNWGITQKTYESWVGRSVSKDEIKTMPRGNAIAIYKDLYWDKVMGDQIKDIAVAFVLFDQAVNRGVTSATKQAQQVLGIYPDGKLGPNTLERINNYDSKKFLEDYLQKSEDFYKNIVERNPSQVVFLKGWLNRVESLRDYAFSNITTVGISIGVIAAIAAGTYILMNKKKLGV